MNDTIVKFGHPTTLIAEYDHWLVLLRPQAPALGSLVLAAKSDATSFAELPGAAFAEQAKVVADIEASLARAIGYEKMNYLMLMMVDLHVHYHVIPRYAGERQRHGVAYRDAGWPKLPDLATAVPLTPAQVADQVAWLTALWPV